MGAAQYDGVPSPDLAARLDQAVVLWRQHYASAVMVTGSKEPGDGYTEAQASARYLRAAGVPAGDILEAGGNDSWENLADAAPVLLARGERTVLMVTDKFHEDRSLAIASSVGLTPTRRRPRTRRSTESPPCRTTPRRRPGWPSAGSSASRTWVRSTHRSDEPLTLVPPESTNASTPAVARR